MAKWEYFKANLGIEGFRWDTEYYKTTTRTTNKIVLQFDPKQQDFESDRHPWKIEFVLKNAKTFKPDDGPNAGEQMYSGGVISEIRMYSKSGGMQIKVTDIDVPLVAVQGWYNREEDYDKVFQYLDGFASTFIGSNNGPESGWDDSDKRDRIRTSVEDDIVRAKGGHDEIRDMGGKDFYDGGAGWDTVNYGEWFWNPTGIKTGIVADLKAGTIKGPDGYIDKVKNIEEIQGTFLRDVMRGDDDDNRFQGKAGNDLIDGRGGFDRADYNSDRNDGGTAGIRANMKTGKVQDGFGNTDTIVNIERVSGTEYRDVFTDNNRSNRFDGREGNDKFIIAGGRDQISGDEGADRFVFIGKKFGQNAIYDFDSDEGDRIAIKAATKFKDLKITSADNGNDTVVKLKGTFTEIYLDDVSSVDKGDFIF